MSKDFKKLIDAAKNQPEPQRLLMLFVQADRENKAKKKKSRGTISPVMCVDKLPEELSTFTNLVKEADGISSEWNMVLMAGMNGEGGQPPSAEEAEPLLNRMANDVAMGQDLSRYFILDRKGNQIEVVSEQ